jgi:hypothetical protein
VDTADPQCVSGRLADSVEDGCRLAHAPHTQHDRIRSDVSANTSSSFINLRSKRNSAGPDTLLMKS